MTKDERQTPEELRGRVEATREELGRTVEALAAKTDVKARAREKADRGMRLARSHRTSLIAAAGALAALLVALEVRRRH
ncbi:DUF3618 domain-containing protein [Streptomyces antibioticus]|uniref:DUF3618 domain-containing protein n=1 Tax=Streptomyces antibioticus TaxID=1890 RepID=UPI003F647472